MFLDDQTGTRAWLPNYKQGTCTKHFDNQRPTTL